MKSTRKHNGDTAKEFLEQLAADRGTILNDQDYESIRLVRLQDLARPPRVEWAVAAPGLACILLGVGVLVAALFTGTAASAERSLGSMVFGLLLVGLGSLFFFGNLRACSAATRRPYAERMSEIDDLLRSGLITTQEHETIRQAIDHESTVRVKKAET
jgi:hypothetical protein